MDKEGLKWRRRTLNLSQDGSKGGKERLTVRRRFFSFFFSAAKANIRGQVGELNVVVSLLAFFSEAFCGVAFVWEFHIKSRLYHLTHA